METAQSIVGSAFELLRNEDGAGTPTETHNGKICPDSHSSCILSDVADCGEKDCAHQFTIIIFPFLALFIGVLATPLSRAIKVSYTLVLLVIGIIIGIIGCAAHLSLLTASLQQWVHLSPPTIFFYVFLAPLIFEASFNTRWHVFKRLLVPIVTAAFIIVGLQVGLIATFQRKVIRTDGWSWWDALMYGAMLSATDPISVTATLKSLGASEFLNTLIEGESLLNDGSAFVLWEAFFENAEAVDKEELLSVGEIIGRIFKLSIGGAAMGVAFGLGALIILGLVYDEFEVEVSLTVIVAFLGFWTAQSPSKLSGVICNVASGLVISAFGHHLITPAVRGPLEEFWELLSWIANTIVFLHAGVLLSAFIWSCAGQPNEWYDYLYIFAYFLYLQVIRMGLILVFMPIMRFRNKWLGWRQAIIVGFSGLRGAVSLVLALEVAGSEFINQEVGARVVLWTTGIVALSLLVNGFFVKPLISVLQLDKADKAREDFLQRARALMVQRTLMILDHLCIETNFKSARWSYVVKNVLPEEWLEKTAHAEGFRDIVEQVLDNKTAARRKSIEIVSQDVQAKMLHSHITNRMSTEFGVRSIGSTPHMTPRPSRYDYASDIARYSQTHGHPRSMQPPRSQPSAVQSTSPSSIKFNPRIRDLGSPEEHNMEDGRFMNESEFPAFPVGPPVAVRASVEGSLHQRSIDVDVERYGKGWKEKPTQSRIHQEVAALHKSIAAGDDADLSDRDREVRRRLLTAILSHVRTISNTSLVEFNVIHNLEQDVQRALDANDEGEEYDLFAFLDNRSRESSGGAYQFIVRMMEGKALRGESAITTAYIVMGIMTEILKEEILHESTIVQWQAEKLYQGAAALLNRLESLNPEAFEWVQSQFAVYVCGNKQDDVLEDVRASGIVDEGEHHTLHEELIEIRRRYINQRHSIFMRARKRIPERLSPRQLLFKHPLFSNLSPRLLEIIDRYGELVHLQAGQALQCQRGSLVFVLQGSIRPLADTMLPGNVASRIHDANVEMDMAVTDRAADARQNMDTNPQNPWNEAYRDGGSKNSEVSAGTGNEASRANEQTYNNASPEESKQNSKKAWEEVYTHSTRVNEQMNGDESSGNSGTGTDVNVRSGHAGFKNVGAGGEMHWCFPVHNTFCGPAIILDSHRDRRGEACDIARERAVDQQFGCCDIAGKATVFTIPVSQVKTLARENEAFRMEITRSLARQIVLESVSDQRPYALSQFVDSASGNLDTNTVVGRATRVLERLPYMKVIALHQGESSSVHMQGPGVLLNGTVRVSIVDTSGLVGAINLLHEQLTGPALLPSGGLFIEEIQPSDYEGNPGDGEGQDSEVTEDVRHAATDIYTKTNNGERNARSQRSQVFAHILVEEIGTDERGVDQTALLRLARWTASDESLDMNGRFGMNRHVELSPLEHVTVQKD